MDVSHKNAVHYLQSDKCDNCCSFTSHCQVSMKTHEKNCKQAKINPIFEEISYFNNPCLNHVQEEYFTVLIDEDEYDEYIEVDGEIVNKELWQKKESSRLFSPQERPHQIHNHDSSNFQQFIQNEGDVYDFQETFPCTQCHFESDSNYDLRKHILVEHTELDLFVCDKCTYQTYLERKLKSHKMTAHPRIRNAEGMYKCDWCNYTSNTSKYMSIHENGRHAIGDEIKWNKCDKCPFKTKYPASVWLHKQRKHRPSRW